MNRGKTALKRGVAVASVAAMAIAGAVLAAPAASANPTATDSIRATPTADANFVNADGSASTTFVGGAPYSGTTPTGTAVVLKPGANNQIASGFQIALPIKDTATGSLKVSLPANISWAAPPQVTVDPVLRVPASLNSAAGVSGTNSNLAQAVANGVNLPANVVGSPSASGQDMTVTVGSYDGTTGGAAAGVYLLTFFNVRLSVAAGVTATTPISATLSSVGFAPATSGVTTLGYVSPLSISVGAGAVSADAAGNVALPNIVVTENVAGALSAADLVLNVTTNGASGKVLFDGTAAPTATATGTGLSVGAVTPAPKTAPALATGTVTIPVTGPSSTAGTVTVSGLKLVGVDKNATLTVSVATPTTSGSAADAGSDFAFAPDLSAVSVDVATAAPEPRIAGADRYATAALIAAQGWPTPANNKAVVIANGETAKNGADALSANYLAGSLNAPILLTEANSLPAATQNALITLFKNQTATIKVYVMGKSDSVSAAVQTQIQNIITSAANLATGNTVTIVPVNGANRYATSAAAATTVGASGLILHSLSTTTAWLPTAFLASGTTNADALAAGSVSAAAGIPVLLADGNALDPTVAKAIKDLGIQQVIALGGTDRISAALVSSLAADGVTSTTRIAGSDRYETAADIYTWAYAAVNPSTGTDRGLGWGAATNTAYIANGLAGFPDALSVGPLAAKGTGGPNPVLTTGADALAPAAAKFLTANKADFGTNGIEALGQSDRISSAVITAAQAALK